MKLNVKNILVLGIIVFTAGYSYAQNKVDEYYLKAVFLERFTRFVKYEQVKEAEVDSFNLVVIGKNPFGNQLNEIYSIQKIYDKPVKISYIRELNQISDGDLLFICGDQMKQIDKILERTKGKSLLLVGDSPGLARKGVAINMIILDNKLRFEINPKAAERNHIKIDRLLMANAILINEEND